MVKNIKRLHKNIYGTCDVKILKRLLMNFLWFKHCLTEK